MAALANAICALVCTYRFQHKGREKFGHLRRAVVAPQLVSSTEKLLPANGGEVKALGKQLGEKAVETTLEIAQNNVEAKAGCRTESIGEQTSACAADAICEQAGCAELDSCGWP